MTLAELNALGRDDFASALGTVFEHSPWIAERAWVARPFASLDQLHGAMVAATHSASEACKLGLLRGHPELAGKLAMSGAMTSHSVQEQAGAGLANCSPEELAQLATLNDQYRERFGFPFILAVKGYDRVGIIAALEQRVGNPLDAEMREALDQVARIARFRLERMITA